MAQTQQATVSEPTFRAYNQEQGATYAQYRQDYNPKLYETIINYHKDGAGQFDTVIDVGCGPGFALRNLAPHFTNAIGLDPSEGMIKAARSIDGSANIRFELSTAETLGSDLATPIPDQSVDLITASACAHWFDMPRFWARAAEILKPGGTVAIWGGSSMGVTSATPNYEAIQAVMDQFNDDVEEYLLPGNVISRDLYKSLPLPWTSDPPVPAFKQSLFIRKEWHTGPDSEQYSYHAKVIPISMDVMEVMVGTASPVQRWREAHPSEAGTEKDIVRMARRKIERLLHEAGVKEGEEKVEGDMKAVLLLFKKAQ